MTVIYSPSIPPVRAAFLGTAKGRKLEPSPAAGTALITATVSDVDPGKRVLLERSSAALRLPTSLRRVDTQAGEANQGG